MEISRQTNYSLFSTTSQKANKAHFENQKKDKDLYGSLSILNFGCHFSVQYGKKIEGKGIYSI